MQQFIPPPMPNMGVAMKHPSDNTDDEPANKKLRTEDSLIPEAQFIQRNTVSFIPRQICKWLLFTCFNALKCN